jgi:hypothetical protein
MLGNGGHNDYYGNEVYSCDLSQATPAWKRRRNATAATSGGTSITTFTDGRKASDHTTQLQVEAGGRWFSAGMASTNYMGSANYRQWWEYSLSTEDYINRYNANYAGGALSVAGLAVYDPIDRQIITIHTGNAVPAMQFVDLDTLQVALNINSPTFNSSNALNAAIDTDRHLLLVRQDDTCFIYNLANKTAAPKAITSSGTGPERRCALHYHPASNAFLTWDGGSTIRKLTPTISSGSYSALAWSSVSAASGNPITPPASAPNGMYNKVQMIRDMGNGQAALVVLPTYSNPDIFVFKVPSAGV